MSETFGDHPATEGRMQAKKNIIALVKPVIGCGAGGAGKMATVKKM
jgi:hypothetical protein